MDSGGDPTLPLPAKSPRLSNPTTIDSLGEDILLDIFLRLPSLPTLVRAALTCRGWRRAVASSPVFRRRFRELHPAPLLGLVAEPDHDALPSFAPAQRRDRDVLAAIRGGDFALTTLLDPDRYASDLPLSWSIHDCRDGYVLLVNWDAGLLATVNPLALHLTDYIGMPFYRNTGLRQPGEPSSLGVHLISSEEEPMSFRLVWLSYNESQVQVAVFSSNTSDWFFHPWVDIAERDLPHNAAEDWLYFGSLSNGMLYWPFRNLEHMLKLDNNTMEFSVLELPPYLEQCYSFVVGETKDGALCIVSCNGWSIDVLRYAVDDNGVGRWISVGGILYDAEAKAPANADMLHFVTIKDGFAYHVASEMILSLCLETMEIQKLFPKSFHGNHFHPYIMAWPPLVGNYGSFAAIQDGGNDAEGMF
jgi:hypothetical protein